MHIPFTLWMNFMYVQTICITDLYDCKSLHCHNFVCLCTSDMFHILLSCDSLRYLWNERMNEWMNEWKNECMYVCIRIYVCMYYVSMYECVCMNVCLYALPSHFNVSTSTKQPSLQCNFQPRKQVKINRSHVRTVHGMLQCCHIVLC